MKSRNLVNSKFFPRQIGCHLRGLGLKQEIDFAFVVLLSPLII